MNKHDAPPFYEGQGYPLAILRLTQVKARTGRSRSSIYADIKAGRFVAPITAAEWADVLKMVASDGGPTGPFSCMVTKEVR
jgi:hypothetical protein